MKKLIIATFLTTLLIFTSMVFSEDELPVPNQWGWVYTPTPLPEPVTYNPNVITLQGTNFIVKYRRVIKYRTSKADQVILYQPEESNVLPAVGADTTRKLSIPKN